ncbi:MAG TPA: hypothetical protein VHY37_10025 [Tepidisphaeraceae bacterium]|jgi:hypothetical protein|nr:hypothetical protein [Tepidisphaeraceae bacterium]
MPVPAFEHEAAERQTLDEIRDWHRGVVEASTDQNASVLHAFREGSAVSPRFVGMTEGDLDAYYDAQMRELDRLTVLNLVACAEAEIKIDYFRRIDRKLKDPLSRAYRKWHKTLSAKKQLRPDFDDGGIIDVLKKAQVMDNNIVGQYRECLRARHWVGHGRYWAKPVEVDRIDPDEAYARADAIIRAIPA